MQFIWEFFFHSEREIGLQWNRSVDQQWYLFNAFKLHFLTEHLCSKRILFFFFNFIDLFAVETFLLIFKWQILLKNTLFIRIRKLKSNWKAKKELINSCAFFCGFLFRFFPTNFQHKYSFWKLNHEFLCFLQRIIS